MKVCERCAVYYMPTRTKSKHLKNVCIKCRKEVLRFGVKVVVFNVLVIGLIIYMGYHNLKRFY